MDIIEEDGEQNSYHVMSTRFEDNLVEAIIPSITTLSKHVKVGNDPCKRL